MVKLDPASNLTEHEPFQHQGVGQHHLQPHWGDLEGWIFFTVPKYHPHSILAHGTGLPGSVPTHFFPFLWSKKTKMVIFPPLLPVDPSNPSINTHILYPKSNFHLSACSYFIRTFVSSFHSKLAIFVIFDHKNRKKRVGTDPGNVVQSAKMMCG